MKRILVFVMVAVVWINSLSMIEASEDIPSTWAVQDINEMKAYNEFRSESFSRYKSDMTRLEFIYIAVRLYEILDGNEVVIDPTIQFEDTKDLYALKGATINLTKGIGEGIFGGDDTLTREQLATFMVRVIDLLSLDMVDASKQSFADDHRISDWAKNAIYLAKSNNIISGVGDNLVDPQGTTSTEMALIIANRILKKYSDQEETTQASTLSFSDMKGAYHLSESSDDIRLWTDLPSERVFKDDAIPSESASGIDVYLAKNEFEPFQLIINPSNKTTVNFGVGDMPSGLSIEMHQVEYVYLDKTTDSLGQEGWYPDPLYPKEFGQSLTINKENTSFWFTVATDETMNSGDYIVNLSVNDIVVPIRIHVFDFAIPQTLHVKSQINISTNNILKKYGVGGTGEAYWMYVENFKQFMIDHRLTPKSALWSGGLTSNGAAPYIDYDSGSGKLSDPHGIWGFEYPASRYLDGDNNVLNSYITNTTFNNGYGFPSFMAMTFRTNDSSVDQRPDSFEGLKRTSADWYMADNLTTPFNTKWFNYISDVEAYLKSTGYLDRAYYYFANEPQNQEDYDALSWYAQALKQYAPDLKLMVSEEPRPEIYNNPKYPNVKIDQWLPVLNNYNPDVSWDREANHDEETWIYFLHGTKPPYFNPITLDHPAIESKLTGWFLWKYRIKGIAHYSFNDWQKNVWEEQMVSSHNGDNFMMYPPSKDNKPIAYGATNHRFVTSIRMELMRDSLEDYEYLYVLNDLKQPVVYKENPADAEADKIVYALTSYNRDSLYMYTLRQYIGLKLSGLMTTIPDIQASNVSERASADKKAYYINFQDPSASPTDSPLVVDGKTYMKIGWNEYSEALGYGWFGDLSHVMYRYIDSAPNALKASIVYDDWGREKVFEFDLPNGVYDVTVSCGWQGKTYGHNHIVIEGVTFIEDEATNPYIVRTYEVEVKDNKLTMEMGLFDEYTMLNYLEIEPK